MKKFEITRTHGIARYNIRIFTRAGRKVFESDQVDNFWYGASNGSKLPADVYYYSIDIMCIQGNNILENAYEGWVKVIR